MTTPFSLTPAPYFGAMPATDTDWDYLAARFWLGQPGNMIELPSPDPANYTVEGSRGRVEHGLGANVSAITQFPSATRRWGLSWQRLASRDFDRIRAIDAGMFGDELVYVQPEDRNHLTLAQSMCGSLHGSVEGWSAAGTLAYDATLAPPIEPSGVVRWTPASTSDRLVANYGSQTIPSPLLAAPNLPGESTTWWVWAKADTTGLSVTPQLVACDALGNPLSTVSGTPVALTSTAWVQVPVTVGPGILGAPFVLGQLAPSSTATVQIACGQFEYRAAPTDWTAGGGSPRVIVPGTLPRQLDVFRNSGLPWVLAESVPGAA